MLNQIIQIARNAGKAILKYYPPNSKVRAQVQLKADASPLTRADLAAHEVALEGLKALDSSIPVISEEGEQPSYATRKNWKRFWLVDPLDGTKEFLKQNNEFTVNIALIDQGLPHMGVVYAPALDLLYYAEQGHGAWKATQGKSTIQIFSSQPKKSEPLIVVESRSHADSKALEDWAKNKKITRLEVGSSLKFCYVAEGRAHCYPRFGNTMEWDVAAGDAIWRNASPDQANLSPITYNKENLRNEPFIIGYV